MMLISDIRQILQNVLLIYRVLCDLRSFSNNQYRQTKKRARTYRLIQLQIQISIFCSYTILMFNLCFNVSKNHWQTSVTFAFLIGKLMVCQAKPSLLEVFHTKSFSSLCSLDHEPSKQDNSCYNTPDFIYTCIQIYAYI